MSAEDAQRRELGLTKAITPAPWRIARRGALEIQAYDGACFPGLAAEWAKWGIRRPFVGALTMELATEANNEAAAWVSGGTPPICFGFGSMPLKSPTEALRTIAAAAAELGERALVCSGWTDFGDEVTQFDHVKVVGSVNYGEVFPACRAVVHHGGSGTTAASLRAGVPTLILWSWPEQPLWGAQVARLKVGAERQLSATTRETLINDLRQILAPECVSRASEFAATMTKPAESAAFASDLLESLVRLKRAS
jgi:UDP:flavonoid glycosyltransferase YjiC (YdhE family)